MSEKRFRTNFDVSIYDSETEEYISVSDRGLEEIAKRMNEQQAINDYLEESNSRLQVQLGETLRLVDKLKEENEQLRQKLECCEYKHFKKEQDKIYQKVKKGDLSDFGTLTISDDGKEHWNGVLK